MTMNNIKAINRGKLDAQAYDDCISRANQSKIYARSWYLDAMSDDWYALVQGNYEAVMPLPIRRKLAFSYVYQPFMVQQLGVFPSSDHDEAFYKMAVSRHMHFDYTFKSTSSKSLHHTPLINLTLPITGDLDLIKTNISTNRKRDLKKAEKHNFDWRDFDDWSKVESLISEALKSGLYGHALPAIQKLYTAEKSAGAIRAAGVYHQNECVFFILYGLDLRRIYYLLPLPLTPAAQEMGVATWSIIHLMKRYSDQYSLFDFEGSAVPGVRKFYESFGSTVEPYYHMKKTFYHFMKHAR